MKLFAVVALCAALAGCGSMPAVIGHCELPQNLAARSVPLADIPTDAPIPRDQADAIWANDRAHAARADAHNDALVDWVGEHCQ